MWMEAQCSLKYHAPDTWHDIPPSHIILTQARALKLFVLPGDAEYITWHLPEKSIYPTQVRALKLGTLIGDDEEITWGTFK